MDNNPPADFLFDVDSIYFGDNDIENIVHALGTKCDFKLRNTIHRLDSNKTSKFTIDSSRLKKKPIYGMGAKVSFSIEYTVILLLVSNTGQL